MNDFNEILETLATLKSKNELEDFFREILTENEIKDITFRWRLMKDILAGESQRQIARKYKISLCKITRGSKILKNENSISKKILLNLLKEK